MLLTLSMFPKSSLNLADQQNFDIFELQSDLRYLGPSVGESSSERGAYERAAFGTTKNPVVVFIGNPEQPQPPQER